VIRAFHAFHAGKAIVILAGLLAAAGCSHAGAFSVMDAVYGIRDAAGGEGADSPADDRLPPRRVTESLSLEPAIAPPLNEANH